MDATGPAVHPPATGPGLFAALARAGRRALSAARPGSPCPVCGDWCATGLCALCLRRFAMPHWRCRRCALPLPPVTTGDTLPGRDGAGRAPDLCGRCLIAPPPVDSTLAALDYDFPWAALITALKFGQRLELADALASRLQDCVVQAGTVAGGQIDLVTAVPLAPARLRQRGYNQAWELARRLARGLGLPARPDALLRCRDTASQSSLRRSARAANLRGAFVPAPWAVAGLAGRKLALVDDVLTTGATAFEAARALRQAGAAEVHLWVLARTPAPAADRPTG